MRFLIPLIGLTCLIGSARSAGLLIPDDKKLPPLAMVHHRVNIAIEDQVAITTFEQSFRNHTDRQLEATYLFPIPKGASVDKFTMWVDGKETTGELLDAKKAAQVYTDIVRRTQDPGILEYMGNNLMRLKVFPVLPKVDQKVKIAYKSIAPQDNGVIEYVYPLKTDGKATRTLEEFSVKATIKSQHPIQNVYSPTHAVSLTRRGDKEVVMEFEKNQAVLDKDFQLFYSLGNKEIGITPLIHRPISAEDGFFLMLISPQIEASKSTSIPRDLVLVLDTSGSMDSVKMDQARKALKYCLGNLRSEDRFGIVSFSTNVRRYRDQLSPANSETIENAKKWVDGLRAGGGTAISNALDSALEMRGNTKEMEGRSFTMVFFTDGQPTIGEMKPENILKSVSSKNSAETRIFTFGVGDDVNTALLDQLADNTKALSTYVRPAEDIEAKVTSLYGKISHPVLANVRMTTSENINIHEVYPVKLPDLFYGSQLVVLGKYSGQGAGAIRMTGQVGKETREFAYDVNFPARTTEDREFVENLWARRKVGFLLDQIRINGEQKELMNEMLTLAKKYGIATPYTSYLVVPDAPMPVVNNREFVNPAPTAGVVPGGPGAGRVATKPAAPPALTDGALRREIPGAKGPTDVPSKVEELARGLTNRSGEGGWGRGRYEEGKLSKLQQELETVKKDLDKRLSEKGDPKSKEADRESLKTAESLADRIREARDQAKNLDEAKQFYARGDYRQAQSGRIGVDVAVCANNLRTQERLTQTANRVVQGRNCLEFGGLWIDEGFNAKMKSVVVKAQSDAYFRILELHPEIKDVYRLGNHLVYVLPSKVALILDTNDGKEKLTDEEIASLFKAEPAAPKAVENKK